MQHASAVLLRHTVKKPKSDHLPFPLRKLFDGASQSDMFEHFFFGSVIAEDQLKAESIISALPLQTLGGTCRCFCEDDG